MLDNYIYKNIEKFGNCIISESDYKRRKNKILNELMKKGFNCNIRVVKTPVFHEKKGYIDITYILEVIK